MSIILTKLIFIFCAIVLSGCNGIATPTPLPTATATLTLTSTLAPAPTSTLTPTPNPTTTPAPTNTASFIIQRVDPNSPPTPSTQTKPPPNVSLPRPQGPLVASWKGIPVMPQATAGEERENTYTYVVKASVNEVKDYYYSELPKVGAEIFAEGAGQVDTTFLFYKKGNLGGGIFITNQIDVTIVILTQPS